MTLTKLDMFKAESPGLRLGVRHVANNLGVKH